MKSGAKRKFTAREEEEQVDNATASEGDAFHYNRNPTGAQPDVGCQTKPDLSLKEKQVEHKSSEVSGGTKDKSQEKPKMNTSAMHNGRDILAPSKLATIISTHDLY